MLSGREFVEGCAVRRGFSGRVAWLLCLVSCFARVQAAQMDETAHVVGQVLHPDLDLGPLHADHSHQRAAHVIGLRAEDMLDAHAH